MTPSAGMLSAQTSQPLLASSSASKVSESHVTAVHASCTHAACTTIDSTSLHVTASDGCIAVVVTAGCGVGEADTSDDLRADERRVADRGRDTRTRWAARLKRLGGVSLGERRSRARRWVR